MAITVAYKIVKVAREVVSGRQYADATLTAQGQVDPFATVRVFIADGDTPEQVLDRVRAEATGPIYAYEREGQYVAALLNQTGTIQGQS